MKPEYIDAVSALVGGEVGGLKKGPLHKLKLSDSQTPPTEEEIQTKLAELQAEYEANEYQRQRAAEYPSWQDQLDKIYHEGLDAWKAEIKAIKDKYPKS